MNFASNKRKFNEFKQIYTNTIQNLSYKRHKKNGEKQIPECHAQGSKVPSMHFRPEYRPDQCGSICTLSFSEAFQISNSKFKLKEMAFIKTPLSTIFQI